MPFPFCVYTILPAAFITIYIYYVIQRPNTHEYTKMHYPLLCPSLSRFFGNPRPILFINQRRKFCEACPSEEIPMTSVRIYMTLAGRSVLHCRACIFSIPIGKWIERRRSAGRRLERTRRRTRYSYRAHTHVYISIRCIPPCLYRCRFALRCLIGRDYYCSGLDFCSSIFVRIYDDASGEKKLRVWL